MTSTFSFGNYDALEVKAENGSATGCNSCRPTESRLRGRQIRPSAVTRRFSIRPISAPPTPTRRGTPANFTTSFNYELPFGRGGSSPPTSTALPICSSAAQQTNGIITLRTGIPYTMSGANCPRRLEQVHVPDYVAGYNGPADQAPSGGRTPSEFFNINNYTVAYSNQAAGIATGGNVGLESRTSTVRTPVRSISPSSKNFD